MLRLKQFKVLARRFAALGTTLRPTVRCCQLHFDGDTASSSEACPKHSAGTAGIGYPHASAQHRPAARRPCHPPWLHDGFHGLSPCGGVGGSVGPAPGPGRERHRQSEDPHHRPGGTVSESVLPCLSRSQQPTPGTRLLAAWTDRAGRCEPHTLRIQAGERPAKWLRRRQPGGPAAAARRRHPVTQPPGHGSPSQHCSAENMVLSPQPAAADGELEWAARRRGGPQ